MQSTSDEKAMLPIFGTRLDGIDYIHRPGVYAVIEDKDKQIAVIATGLGYFLPGGGVDSGETEVEALKREIIEEMGYQVSVLGEIGEAVEYLKGYTDGKYYRIASKFYRVQLKAKIGKRIEEDHRLVWLGQAEVLKLLARRSQVWAIQRMAKG